MMDFDSLVKGIKEDDYDAMNHLAELFDLSTPMPVKAGGWDGLITSPAIPYCSRCGKAIPCDLEYLPYCPDCGQRLDWDDFLKMGDEDGEV